MINIVIKLCKQCKSCNVTTNSLRQALLTKALLNVKIGMMVKCNMPMINGDNIYVNNVNLVLQQQIASGKHFCISLTKALLSTVIDMFPDPWNYPNPAMICQSLVKVRYIYCLMCSLQMLPHTYHHLAAGSHNES